MISLSIEKDSLLKKIRSALETVYSRCLRDVLLYARKREPTATSTGWCYWTKSAITPKKSDAAFVQQNYGEPWAAGEGSGI